VTHHHKQQALLRLLFWTVAKPVFIILKLFYKELLTLWLGAVEFASSLETLHRKRFRAGSASKW